MSEDSTLNSFRRWGHLQADLDFLGRVPKVSHDELDQATGPEAKLGRKYYCSTIGTEFMHIPYPDRNRWLAERLESEPEAVNREFIFKRILESEGFERFIHKRYVGTKRFSLEGLSSLIPLLDSVLDRAAEDGYEYAMIGMSHRGRLNVMVNMVETAPSAIFSNFEDVDPRSVLGSGDVKYHKGATGNYKGLSGKTIGVRLASNPSHLEAVNPVVMGRARARQERLEDNDRSKILAILIHGDAAFAGQGINAETLNFSGLSGFDIGGTIHIIANNLIGFTANPASLHASRFATEVIKRLPAPIFHVNGEAPDSVYRVGRIAVDYKKEFKSDVLINLIGYRRFGHSEIDDPTITQPALYHQIKARPFLFESYGKEIGLSDEEIKKHDDDMTAFYSEELEKGRAATSNPSLFTLPDYWEPYVGGEYKPEYEVPTSLAKEQIEKLAKVISSFPEDFKIHPKVKKGLDLRLEMGLGKRPIDWGMAEALAFGSLLNDNIPVRVVGQDSRRGTFNHRQAVLYDYEDATPYIPLQHIHENQARLDVYDSFLSEAAALGFEYGFTRDYPESLVCWEAQFGDFANGAQIIIDQFISAGEDKWYLMLKI